MISSPPKGRQTRKAKIRNTSRKCLKGIGEKQVDVNFYVMNIAAAALDKVLGNFLKMQNGGEYEPDSFEEDFIY